MPILNRNPPGRPPETRIAPAQILGIASGKGGVGKTWLATTLACCFAQLGQRTLLVDGDLGLANVDVHLGIAPESDLSTVIAGWIELEDAVTPVQGGVSQKGGFDVLAGRSGSGALASLPQEEVARLATALVPISLHYDQVIVDLGAGIEDNVMRLARACDRMVVVVTDEPASMTDAYAFIKTMRGHAPAIPIWVVVNMADTATAGRRTFEAIGRACQTFLGFRPSLAGVVQRDTRVREAVRCQKPLPLYAPQAQATLEATKIAETLLRANDPSRGPRPSPAQPTA
jgi:flagellar biosynthesis protein FlhG